MSAGPTDRPLDDPDAQAEVFDHVRRAHSMESTEDYVELIGDLIETRGEARLVEIAERLGISRPSVGKTVARLQREGFVTSEPYRSIFLTDKGRALAEASRARHDVVYRFLVAIGVGEETARRDSEGGRAPRLGRDARGVRTDHRSRRHRRARPRREAVRPVNGHDADAPPPRRLAPAPARRGDARGRRRGERAPLRAGADHAEPRAAGRHGRGRGSATANASSPRSERAARGPTVTPAGGAAQRATGEAPGAVRRSRRS